MTNEVTITYNGESVTVDAERFIDLWCAPAGSVLRARYMGRDPNVPGANPGDVSPTYFTLPNPADAGHILGETKTQIGLAFNGLHRAARRTWPAELYARVQDAIDAGGEGGGK